VGLLLEYLLGREAAGKGSGKAAAAPAKKARPAARARA